MPIARWFAIAVIASLLGVAVPSGWAQLETTKILFESTRDGDSEIYVMDVDGANPTNLTQSPTSEDVNPEWSADGTRVAFASDRSGNMDIWVMDADGGNLERITTHAASDTKPTWRPDGSEIAFVSDRDGDLEIHVVDVVTKAAENRTLSPGYSETDPDWASDGTEILFASDRNGTFDIHRMDTASFATTPVAVLAGYHEVAPTLSYDGAQIAYDRYQVGGNPDVVAGLYTVGFDGSNPMPRAAYGGDRNPSWAPDGSKIAYELSGSIMTVDTDAAGIKTTLTTGGFDANPSWSVALPQVTVSVSPLSVDLADVEVGSSGAATFTITSTGTATLTISDIASDDAAFTVAPNTGTPPFDLTSGESETVTVTFTPTVEGAQTASVTITHNAAGSPSVVTATGTGTALSGPPPDAVTVIDAQGALASLVSIPIEIYDVTGLGVVGVAMSLTYRSDILTPTSTAGDTTAVTVDSGVVPASWTLEQNTELIDATTSQLNFSMAGDFADPLAGPGTLVDIAFDVTATAPGDPLGRRIRFSSRTCN